MTDTARWNATDDFPYDDIQWTWCDNRRVPGHVSVDATASNSYGPPIYAEFVRDGAVVGMWFDLETWDAMYEAGLKAHAQRIQMTEDGWT